MERTQKQPRTSQPFSLSTIIPQRTTGRNASWDPTPDVRAALSRFGASSDWTDALSLHCSALAAVGEGRARDGYDALSEAVSPFLKLFRDAPDAWLVEPLVGLATSLRLAAAAADVAASGNGGGGAPPGGARLGSAGAGGSGAASTKALESCGAVLQRCFAASMQGGGPPGAAGPSKKDAALSLVVTLFRVYFALNTLRLSKNLINAVNSRQFPPLASFPRGQVVAYQYFTGRLALFDEDYAAADAALGAAFDACPPSAAANRARLAFFLIPVRLLRGVLPSASLLKTYGLNAEYGPIVEAVKTGGVGGLDRALEGRQWAYIKAGTYLLLDKLRFAVARRLIKRVAILHAAADPARAAQLPLASIATALAWQGAPSDPDSVECLVANLIFRRYVKGYLAHRSGVLVLSKADPFPPLSGVALADPV